MKRHPSALIRSTLLYENGVLKYNIYLLVNAKRLMIGSYRSTKFQALYLFCGYQRRFYMEEMTLT